MKKIVFRFLILFFCIMLCSCDWMMSLLGGEPITIEIVNIDKFNISEDIILLDVHRFSDVLINPKTYAVNYATMELVGEIEYSQTPNTEPPADVCQVGDVIYSLSSPAAWEKYDRKVLVSNPKTGKVEKEIEFEYGAQAKMYYFEHLDQLIIRHTEFYHDSSYIDKYGGNNPITVIDTEKREYIKTLWSRDGAGGFYLWDDGNIWGMNEAMRENAKIGIFDFSGDKLGFTEVFTSDCYGQHKCFDNGEMMMLNTGYSEDVDEVIVVEDYGQGEEYSIPVNNTGVAHTLLHLASINLCEDSGKIFLKYEIFHSSIGGLAVLERNPASTKWEIVKYISEEEIKIYNSDEIWVKGGKLIILRDHYEDERVDYTTGQHAVDFYSTDTLEHLGEIILD